jgi:hypothetical protein
MASRMTCEAKGVGCGCSGVHAARGTAACKKGGSGIGRMPQAGRVRNCSDICVCHHGHIVFTLLHQASMDRLIDLGLRKFRRLMVAAVLLGSGVSTNGGQGLRVSPMLV